MTGPFLFVYFLGLYYRGRRSLHFHWSEQVAMSASLQEVKNEFFLLLNGVPKICYIGDGIRKERKGPL